MYFLKSKNKKQKSGLIKTTLGIFNINELKNVNKNDELYFDYMDYLEKDPFMKNLKNVIDNLCIINQINLVNFCDDTDELLKFQYINDIVKKKKSYLVKNVNLISLINEDYIHYILNRYEQHFITDNDKYNNQIYINNSHMYFCINGLTKFHFSNYKCLHKDKNDINNIIVMSIHDLNNCMKKAIDENTENELYGISSSHLIHIFNKPLDLLGLLNIKNENDYDNIKYSLKNILINNHSENVEIYEMNLEISESYYLKSKENEEIDWTGNIYSDKTNNENEQNCLLNLDESEIYNELLGNTNFEQNISKKRNNNEMKYNINNYTNIKDEYNFNNISNLRLNNILTEEKDFEHFLSIYDKNYFYELNISYLEEHLFNNIMKLDNNEKNNANKYNSDISYKEIEYNKNDINKYNKTIDNNFIDLYDIENKKNKIYHINNKKMFFNHNLSEDTDNLSYVNEIENKNINKNYEKKNKNEDCYNIINKKNKNKFKSIIANIIKDEPILIEDDILNKLKTSYDIYIQDHIGIIRKFSPINKQNKKNNKIKLDVLLNILIEYIGKIHLNIKINYEEEKEIFIKNENKKHKVQKIIINNGLIHNSNLKNICNFLIQELLKKKNNKNKLQYVLSIYSKNHIENINVDNFYHIYFFCNNNKIYITMININNFI